VAYKVIRCLSCMRDLCLPLQTCYIFCTGLLLFMRKNSLRNYSSVWRRCLIHVELVLLRHTSSEIYSRLFFVRAQQHEVYVRSDDRHTRSSGHQYVTCVRRNTLSGVHFHTIPATKAKQKLTLAALINLAFRKEKQK
jgi:hypothetical protein